ncbi:MULTISPECIES: hypothetical protein [Achromobacter]|uniref:hypothetical protein n=1 Tax=Achromobacter TaxID=222 RepID=UPI0006C2D24D|nr:MULTISPECIES: hypothetical protein [Achromobacter]CUJ71925.1 Uncharacterised protein [Achromobacter sp. 2789STDY5608628]CUJ76972.1 Uncharacterised protein [Achromobacter sp. 2789STDY5608633]
MSALQIAYLAAGLVAAAVLYPWLVRNFGDQAQTRLARAAYFRAGVVLAWPVFVALPVGVWFERRAKAKKDARERAYRAQLDAMNRAN